MFVVEPHLSGDVHVLLTQIFALGNVGASNPVGEGEFGRTLSKKMRQQGTVFGIGICGTWVQRGYQFTSTQRAALDWVRGLSAQMVLLGHTLSAAGLWPEAYFPQCLGVAAFFVLSGLLVTSSVTTKRASYGFNEYLIDRGTRIFVPYVPAIAFIVLASWLLGLGGPIDAPTVVGNLLMLEDYPFHRIVSWFSTIDRVGTGRPLWSVAMEWWIYMGMAAVYFVGRLPLWSAPLVLAGLIVLGFNMMGGSLGVVWIAGGIIALALPSLPRNWPWKKIVGLLLCGTVLRMIATGGNFYDLTFDLLLAALLAAALLAIERMEWIERSAGLARFIAGYSYTLYLTHYTVMTAISDDVARGPSRVVYVFVASNLVAMCLWWLFERHHRHVAAWLRRKFIAPAGATSIRL